MARILRLKDRIKVKIGDVEFTIAPLSNEHKNQIYNCTKSVAGQDTLDLFKAQSIYLKHGLKEVSGIEDYSGEPYKLSFEGDSLTDECVSEISMIECKDKLMEAAWAVLSGNTEPKIKGVKVEVSPAGK